MCTPVLSWVDCNYNYGTRYTDPIRCSNGSTVDLLAQTGCFVQGGTVDQNTVVSCPTTKDTVESVSITIYDSTNYRGGPGCANVTKTFYLENTGEAM